LEALNCRHNNHREDDNKFRLPTVTILKANGAVLKKTRERKRVVRYVRNKSESLIFNLPRVMFSLIEIVIAISYTNGEDLDSNSGDSSTLLSRSTDRYSLEYIELFPSF
jgi:hypothetical protein